MRKTLSHMQETTTALQQPGSTQSHYVQIQNCFVIKVGSRQTTAVAILQETGIPLDTIAIDSMLRILAHLFTN